MGKLLLGRITVFRLGTRWLINTLTLLFGVGLIVALWIHVFQGRTPEITKEPAIGIGYFFVVGCFELFRFYDVLIDRKRLSRKSGQSVSTTA